MLLSLDLGNRRIGLGTGGTPGVPAVPIGHIERRTLKEDLARVLAMAEERGVSALVVGIPYSLPGDTGEQARLAQGFVRELRKRADIPVHTVDERFTSQEAEGLLRESGVQPSRRKGDVDAVAAVLILERYLSQSQG